MNQLDRKQMAIQHIKGLMDERKLKFLFLEKILLTTWPIKNDKRPYQISEISIDDESRIRAWQHWGQSDSGFYIEYFDEQTVVAIESVVNSSLQHMRQFRVEIKGYVNIEATSEGNAMKMVKHHSGELKAVSIIHPDKAIDLTSNETSDKQ